MIQIPVELVSSTVQREGPAGRAWIDALPCLADDLLARWNCTPSAAPTCGQVGLIMPMHRADGSDGVVKISFPHPGNAYEPDALTAYRGNGAVRAYDRFIDILS
ncbi:MAG TPA: hypothetical protein VHC49_24445 [Mycobacteriales bacterium]|nr:hypothetical protein [Mycobacteriales bacterium]